MTESRPWTEYQDLILKKLKDQDKIPKWTVIAEKMADQYNLKGRNGKQCKERYQMLFDDNDQTADWNYQQQQKLFALHSQLGNKWAIIGQQIMNRSDNQVKNHLYSKLRKALRKMNKIIKQNFKKQFKEIKQNLIYKIIEGAQDKFKNTPLLDSQVSDYCTQLKLKILNYSYDDPVINPLHDFQNNKMALRQFIEQLIEFSKDYKRKPKKVRRASGQQLDTLVMEDMNILSIPKDNKRIRSTGNSPCNSEVSEQDSQQMAEFNTFSLKIPNDMFGIKISKNSSGNSNKQIKENIILQLPTDFKSLHQMTDEKQQHHNGYGGFSNFATEQKGNQMQNMWIPPEKSIDPIWSSKNSDSIWKGTGSSEMVDENFQVQNQLRKFALLEEQQQIMYNPPFPTNIKKLQVSKKSSFSNFQIDQQQEHMFGDDSVFPKIQMTGVEGKKLWILDSSLQRSDKLFKSNEAYGMFQSVQSKKSDALFNSIGKQQNRA